MAPFRILSGVVSSNLEQALLSLEQRLQAWAADDGAFAAVLQQAFGARASGTAAQALRQGLLGDGLGLTLELAPLADLRGAYAAATSAAEEVILLDSGWLPTASAAELEAVLLEELGHGIDQRLNGSSDSPGDEGEIFSALLRGSTPRAGSASENDQRLIAIDGQLRLVEASAPDTTAPTLLLNGSRHPAFSGSSIGFGLPDVGSQASPDFADIDGDGDLDAFIGTGTGSILFFQNTGNATSAAFAGSSIPFGFPDLGDDASPTLVDIDGDGDLDAFLGNRNGNTRFYKNTGSFSSPAFAASVFALIDIGSNASPAFADIDGDGDLDAFIGDFSGRTLFFRNTGSASSTFSAAFAGSSLAFGFPDVGSYASPTLVDIDGDGDLDAFIGNYQGNTRFFENTGSATSPAFAISVLNPFGLADVVQYATPTFADIDGDGDLDAFIGNGAGSTLFFRNTGVEGLRSSTANGTYQAGAVITILVPFSEVVFVTGIPQLKLETGYTDRYATYSSGSGTDTLSFTYTVQAGDNSTDLDYTATTALELNGGSIKDAAGNAATLTLPTPGAAGSLGLNQDLVIVDITAPTITANVTSSNTNGSYKPGDVITILVPFSELVIVTGIPQLKLETGSTDRYATYSSGSGTSTLSFTYTVQAGDSSADLDYTTTTALELNGGTIKDAAGNAAILTLPAPGAAGSLAANQNLVVDTTAPTVLNNGSRTPAFAGSSIGFGLPNVGSFATPTLVDIDGDGDLDAFIGNNVGSTLFFRNTGSAASAAFAGSSSAFGLPDVGLYATPTLVDIDADGDLDAFIGNNVGNTLFFRNTGSAASPAFAGSSIGFGLPGEGSAAQPTFADIDGDGDLDAFIGNKDGNTLFFRNTGSAASAAFAGSSIGFGLSDAGFSASPTFADIDGDGDLDAFIGNKDGNTLFFRNTGNAASAAFAGSSIGFGLPNVGSYATPTLVDIDGDGDLDAFIGNNVGSTLFFRNTGSAGVSSSTTNGTYKARDVITILVAFSEVVTVTGTPQLKLETGSTDRYATYSSGSGTNTLSFTYTVQAGDSSADLDYTATNALELNGGTIKDAAGNAATLTLPAPGTAGSLGLNQALVVDTAPRVLNNGSRTPAFAGSSIGFGLPDVGSFVSPTFADIDGDGDLDAFIGNYDGSTLFFRNTGSAASAAFAGSSLGFGLPNVGSYATPTLVDIDADGDLDAFIGNQQGSTLFFRNTGTAASPAFAGSSIAFGLPDVGNYASPTLADIDGDGDLDAFIGNQQGSTLFFRNTGSAASAAFAGSSIAFGLPAVGSYASPAFADIDGDGDLDAFIGNKVGSTLFFRNTGTAASPAFAGSSIAFGLPSVGNYASPTLADIDGDGDLDAFIGEKFGNTLFFRNTGTGGVTSSNNNGTYKAGDVITILVPFSEVVIVTGIPQLKLETGSTDRYATYSSGSGTTTLSFTYTVQAGDSSADLDYTATNALELNGGTIKDAAGNAAILTLPAPGTAGSLGLNQDLVVDGVAPTVLNNGSRTPAFAGSSIGFGLPDVGSQASPDFADIDADGDLDAFIGNYDGSTLFFRNTGSAASAAFAGSSSAFGLPDVGLTASPALVDIDGDGDLDAFIGNQQGSTLFFRNTGSASSPAFAGSSIAFGLPDVGNYASPALVDIDGDGDLDAFIGDFSGSTLFFRNTGSAASAAFAGSSIAFGLPAVGSYASPAFADIDGDGDLDAFIGNKVGSTLFFRNTGTAASPAFAGSSIAFGLPSVGNYASPTLADIDGDGDLDAFIGEKFGNTLFFRNIGGGVTSSTANGTYQAGDVITILVPFSEVVIVTGIPQLKLETGSTDRYATYSSGSGTTTLSFTYTVQAGDSSADLDYTATNALELNGGTIKDAAGNAATLTLPAPGAAGSLGANQALVVATADTTAPTFTGNVTSSNNNGTYKAGDVITIRVPFSEVVTVTGIPQLKLETGNTDRYATYSSGSGTTTLSFTYTVQAGDSSADLDYTATNALELNGGTIKDAAGNAATLTLPAPGTAGSLGLNQDLGVDGVAPTVTANITSSNTNGTYKAGDVITIRVPFSEVVTVTGIPQLKLETGSTDRYATYSSGSGTTTLSFTYTVQAGDSSADLDYTATNALELNGGTIKDAAGNAATLTLPAPGTAGSLGLNQNLVVDTSAPTFTGNVTSSNNNGTYKAGDVITILVPFSEVVTVTGIPQLKLETGNTDRYATYSSGSGTDTLSFTYTVQAGDSSADLDYTATNALELNGGTIKDAAGNAATLTLPAPGTAGSLGLNQNLVVDTSAPTFTGNVTSSNNNGTYKAGDVITIRVPFSEVVTVTGIPQLKLETGNTDRYATYSSGSGTDTLSFTYTVQAGDSSADLDYTATNALELNGGTIKDAAGNAATLTLPAPGTAGSLGLNQNLVVDTTAPTVLNNGSRNPAFAGSSIGFGLPDVGFSASPTFADIDGDGDLDAFIGNNAGSTLFFRNTGSAASAAFAGSSIAFGLPNVGLYATPTLVDIDADGDLDAFIGNSNGNTFFFRNTGSAASPAFAGSSIAFGLPSVGYNASPALVDIDGDGDLDAFIGEKFGSTLFFRNTGTAASPAFAGSSIGFDLPDVGDYASPTLADIDGDGDLDAFIGERFGSTLFFRNTGTAASAAFAGSSIAFGLPSVGNFAIPTLADIDGDGDLDAFIGEKFGSTLFFRNIGGGVTSSTANGTYKAGDVITILVPFSEVVIVTGIPQLKLETGSTDRYATYSSGSGTTTLSFTYTVQAGDSSADLDYTATNALELNGGTIKDAAGNAATLTLPAPGAAGSLGANQALVVATSDTTAPTFTGNVTSSNNNGTYKAGDVITIRVPFSEVVTVTGIPQLKLETGNTDRYATYSSGSGTDTLSFTYTVQAGDSSADLDYTATNALELNGGTIKDAAGNAATLTLPAPGTAGSLGANQALVVDTTAPTFTGNVTSSNNNGTYKAGDVITILVPFSEVVTVTGIPQLKLETGNTDRYATYSSGSGTTTLSFTYTVQAGDSSADLDYTATNALELNGGTIQDAAGNAATLTLPAPGTAGSLSLNQALVVDTTAPTFTGNVTSSNNNGTYKAGDVITIRVPFSEVVTVTGIPQLKLETGSVDRYATYSSGSGTNTLFFTYTVQAGDSSADLDYTATNALELNGGTIKDAAGNAATLTLPAPGAAGSLGLNQDLVVATGDTTAPTVLRDSAFAGSSIGFGLPDVGNSANPTFADIDADGDLDAFIGNADGDTLFFENTGNAASAAFAGSSIGFDLPRNGGIDVNGFAFPTFADIDGDGDLDAFIGDVYGNTLFFRNTGSAASAAFAGSSIGFDLPNVGLAANPSFADIDGDGDLDAFIGDAYGNTLFFRNTGSAASAAFAGSSIGFDLPNLGSIASPTFADIDADGDLDAFIGNGAGNTLFFENTGTAASAAFAGSSIAFGLPSVGNYASPTLADIDGDGDLDAFIGNGYGNTLFFRNIGGGVTSSTANGTYQAGDVITILVPFSEVVIVTGIPQLKLETGSTDRYATYSSGSGTTTLSFTYTVQAGDSSADLDYTATNALELNGGTIQDAAGNAATLTLPAPGTAGSLGANQALVIDGVAPTVLSNVTSSNNNGTYKAGDVITIRVPFSEVVNVTGIPQLQLETGSTDRYATYSSGSGTDTLSFTYTVQAGDSSADLDYTATNALELNGGTIKDAAGNAATLTLPAPGTAGSLGLNQNLVVDTTAPTFTGNVTSSNNNGTYKAGDVITILVPFSEVVTVTGIPQLKLETGNTDRYATYSSGSGTTTLSFTYTVQAGDSSADLDYTATNALELNGGTIKDAAGNAATLTLPAPGTAGSLSLNQALVVDTTAPTFTGNVTSSNNNGTYKAGDVITIRVPFSEVVTVTGIPQLKLETGNTDRYATYSSGSGTDTLSFTYTVQAGDSSADLDYTATNALELNGGTIKDAAGNAATLTLPAPGAAGSLGANQALVVDTSAPTFTGNVTSSNNNGTYKAGDVITILVPFSEVVTVTGIPQLKLETGNTDRYATYSSGSGTDTLSFTYTVQAGDSSADLDYTATNALELNGGTIKDAAGNAATLTLPAPGAAGSLGANQALVVDTSAPTFTGNVTSSNNNGTYKAGDVITILVPFSEVVTVTGTPQLKLETGNTDRYATYSSGSGTDTLSFTYTVQAGDSSADLDYTATNALELNGGTIKDAAGNAATLTLPAPGTAGSLGANQALVVDTSAPTFTGNVTSSNNNGTYKAGDVITIRVPFSEVVTVTGIPQLKLETGNTDRYATYSSGSGTDTLSFTYTVQAGDSSADLDYTATNALELNGGTIKDAAGNAATLTLPAPGTAGSLGANQALVVDTSAPTFTGNVTSSNNNGTYKAGDVITIRVPFSEVVTVTGIPQLKLETGNTDRYATYSSGSGTDTLSFTYTVQAGDSSADLDYTATNALELNGGTIKDAAGNAATLTLPAPGAAGSLGANQALVVDTSAPTFTGNVTSSNNNGTYKAGDVITILVPFSEVVTVTGIPQLKLETGSVDRYATYSSGSGTDTLSFTYTVQAGDSSADLDYTATNALELNGGTIKDAAGNAATLTLPAPGTAGSLGLNQNLVVDTSAPTFTGNVTSSNNNGTYKAGDVITILVPFSEVVTVTGIPQLKLETGNVDRYATYSSGSGTDTLSFTYTVQAGDSSADLDYTATNALELNGGTIKDAAGNAATLTLPAPGAAGSLGLNQNLVVDTSAPPDTSAPTVLINGSRTPAFAGSSLGFGLSDAGYNANPTLVDIDGDGDLDAFIGNKDGNTLFFLNTGSASRAAFTGSSFGFGLPDVRYNASPTLVDIDGDGDLDAFIGNKDGNTLFFRNTGSASRAAFTGSSLGFGLPDVGYNASPALVDIDGDGDLDAFLGNKDGNTLFFRNTGSASRAAFTGSSLGFGLPNVGSYANPTFADIDGDGDLDAFIGNQQGSTLFFRNTGSAASAAFAGSSLGFGLPDVGYNASPTLADIDGDGDLDVFIGNKDGKALFFRNTGTAGGSGGGGISSSTANGTYQAGAVITILVPFSEVVIVTGIPQLKLETGSIDRYATYSSGSGTSTLAFTYTVQAGDSSADLDYTATNALELNGGSIKDADGNNAILTLPAPGAAGSLGANQALVIATSVPPDTSAPTVLINGSRTPAFAGSSLGFGLSDAGYNANPTLVDIDGDGDLDAFIGNKDGNTLFFLNTGSASRAAFTGSSFGFGLPDVRYNASPTLVDIDGDGDLDAFIGNKDGNTLFFLNTGSASRAAFTGSSLGFGLPDVGYNASPALVDIDGDGDLDAFLGNKDGNTLFFRNTGSASRAAFTGSSLGFGLPNVGSYANPTFADIDGDGDLDAFIGNQQGSTLFFRNTGSAASAAFAGSSLGFGLPDVGYNASPTLADIDGDGDLDVFIGNKDGNTLFFRNTGTGGVTSSNNNGTYKAGDVITIRVPFSEVVTVTGTPQLKLETGSIDRYATYSSGSGTSTLAFTYTVQAGDSSADLDYTATNALELNGGSIKDADGNNAILTLPAPGAAGSLGANQALVISNTSAAPISSSRSFAFTPQAGDSSADPAIPTSATRSSDQITGLATEDPSGGITIQHLGSASAQPFGRGSHDILTGDGGEVIFVLGTDSAVLYNDRNRSTDGRHDFATITNFSAGSLIQLKGEAADYQLSSGRIGAVNGTLVHWRAAAGAGRVDELIGFIEGLKPAALSLTDSRQFSYL